MTRKRRRHKPSGEAAEISLQYAAPRTGLPARCSIERWIRAALDRDARITLRITGAREARLLNRSYRARDYATNVLSFGYARDARALEGDIVLCAPVVAREARALGKPLRAHYAHLVVHGVLHLAGLDHEDAAAAERMQARETAILAQLGYADPYARPAPPQQPRRIKIKNERPA